MTADDEQGYRTLMVSAQRGDAEAYERCLSGLSRELRAYVRSRVGDVPWVDDVVQDCLISLHGARHTYDAERSFAAWFYAIARNRMIDGLRHEARRQRREIVMDVLPDRAAAPREHEGRALQDALVHLPARQREIITALKVEGDSVREVAGRLGMTEGAVKVAAHRGYEAIRCLLRHKD